MRIQFRKLPKPIKVLLPILMTLTVLMLFVSPSLLIIGKKLTTGYVVETNGIEATVVNGEGKQIDVPISCFSTRWSPAHCGVGVGNNLTYFESSDGNDNTHVGTVLSNYAVGAVFIGGLLLLSLEVKRT